MSSVLFRLKTLKKVNILEYFFSHFIFVYFVITTLFQPLTITCPKYYLEHGFKNETFGIKGKPTKNPPLSPFKATEVPLAKLARVLFNLLSQTFALLA